MSTSMKVWLIIAAALLYLTILVICRLLIKRLKIYENTDLYLHTKNILLNPEIVERISKKRKLGASDYLRLKQFVYLDQSSRELIEKNVEICWAEKRYLKGLNSAFKIKRIESSVYMGLLGTDLTRIALEKAIIKEKDTTVRLYMANALSDIGNSESISVLVESLINSNRFYRDKVNMMIADFGGAFDSYLPKIIDSKRIEIKELIVDFATEYFSENTKAYLLTLIDEQDREIQTLHNIFGNKSSSCANCIHCTTLHEEESVCKFKGPVRNTYKCGRYRILPVSISSEENYKNLVYKACTTLASYYPKELDNEKYLNSDDLVIKNISIRALSSMASPDRIKRLIPFLNNEDTVRSAVNAISMIIENSPGYINLVAEAFCRETEIKIKQELAVILSGRVEYFIMKLSSKGNNNAKQIITAILSTGRNSEVIDFLNKNKDTDIENELVSIIKEVMRSSASFENEFSKYLKDRIAYKCGLVRCEEPQIVKEAKRDKRQTASICMIIAASLLLFPAIYIIKHWNILFLFSFTDQLKIFIIDFNYFLAYYSMVISLIYLGLLMLSYISAKKQARLWRVKNMSLLFKKNILPTVSIIAPAYNEEKTIIESANSLLNLKYPDYELIIVNDGSKDNTLDVLIRYFDLIRVDYVVDSKLNTKPVRGIYMNRHIPKLIVVDKENGGKADSLNSGINISKKEYFCGIDADSLLESDALLKLASLTLDEAIETPALGGNIFPINGCTIEQGQIKNIRIPDTKLARLQTVEYTRAFMSGRLGWAFLNSLLIISGAFGLFRKERVINVGGYLTKSGKYERDTVGEDMELVVRICRFMRELKHSFRICYSFNANCWTEVPEDIKSLKKQRYRWHRGLIEILLFHRKMLMNPRYGNTGTIAIPYYFLFEMFGPLIEIQGYIMVVLAIIFGLINTELALILFITTVLMGVLISASSLAIEETDADRFKLKDLFILIMYSFIENFGPRQLISFWRVTGLLSMLKKPAGWEKALRKGFVPSNSAGGRPTC